MTSTPPPPAPGAARAPAGPRLRGVGIDVAGIDRLARLARSERALARWFTDAELAACRRGDDAPAHAAALAAHLAAKEAVIKVLGFRWEGPVTLRDIEITLPRVRLRAGAPAGGTVRLSGRPAQVAAEAGITAWHVSVSRTGDVAVATALAY